MSTLLFKIPGTAFKGCDLSPLTNQSEGSILIDDNDWYDLFRQLEYHLQIFLFKKRNYLIFYLYFYLYFS